MLELMDGIGIIAVNKALDLGLREVGAIILFEADGNVKEAVDYEMEKMKIKRAGLERVMMLLRRAAMARIKIMPWEISWFPTFGCNLKCDYCNSIIGKKESANPSRCVDTIIELAPASISILGGEPYIVPKIIDYLERLRKGLPDLFILMTTNGMVDTDKLRRSMSLVSSLCVSMDGLGEYTTKHRIGADPDRILENVKACAEERKRLGLKTDLVVNSVVTRHNAMHLPEFYKLIHSIDPTILNFSQGMQPFESPDSIGSDPEIANEYLKQVAELKKDIRILLAGRLADGELRNQESHEVTAKEVHHRFDQAPHTCYQERFNTFLSPSGNLYSCRRYSGINIGRGDVAHHMHKCNPFRALGAYAKLWFEFVVMPPTFECFRFCGCPEWINDIIKATCEEELPPEIFRVRGRMFSERIRESGDFIRKYVNKDFQDSFLMPKKEVSVPGETPESEETEAGVTMSKCKFK